MKETMDSIRLQVLTVDAVVYDGMIGYAELPLENGSVGILRNHAPMMGALSCGVIKAHHAGGVDYMAVSQGVVNVAHNEIILLARTAERAENIDMARAVAAEKRARGYLEDKDGGWNQDRALAALYRSLARQSAARLAGR